MSTEQTPTTPATTETPSLMSEAGTQTAEQIAAAAKAAETAAPAEWKDDPAKSADENKAGKEAFDKAATEKKTADEAKAKTDKEAADKAKANDTKQTPFKVEELTALIPQGMELDPAVSKDFGDLVNKYGLGRDAVADLVKLQTGLMQSTSEKGSTDWTKTQDEWKATVMKDPDIGGAKNPEVMARVAFLRDAYGKDIPDLKQALDMTGAGNHPAFIKWVNNISQDLVEGTLVSGGQPKAELTLAQKIYDKK